MDLHAKLQQRQRIVRHAREVRAEIGQIFTDAGHWNDHVRKPGEDPIAADPDGELHKIAESLDLMLAVEDVLRCPVGTGAPVKIYRSLAHVPARWPCLCGAEHLNPGIN